MSTSQSDLEQLLSAMANTEAPRKGSTYVSTFTGTTYDEFIDYLASGKGVDVMTFNDVGLKSLDEFWQECQGRDIVLSKDSDGMIYRHAKSSKVMVVVPSARIRYREVGREFLRKGVYVEHASPKWEAISETGKRDEMPIESAICGIGEELGMGTSIDTLVCLDRTPRKPDRHRSSVYPGILSVTLVTRFRLELPEPLQERKRRIKDGSVRVHIEAFKYNPPE